MTARKTPPAAKAAPRKRGAKTAEAAGNVFELRPDSKPKNAGQKRNEVSPRSLLVAQRRDRAVSLKISGASFTQIADAVQRAWPDKFPGYDSKAASADVREALDRIKVENVGDYLAEAVASMEALKLRLADKISKGDVEAINAAVRIEARKAALLGLDADKRIRLLGPTGGPVEVEHQFGDDEDTYTAALAALDEIAPPVPPRQIEA